VYNTAVLLNNAMAGKLKSFDTVFPKRAPLTIIQQKLAKDGPAMLRRLNERAQERAAAREKDEGAHGG